MSGSTLGKLFTLTSFGESHGIAIGCVVDGCPPGMTLSESDIQPELDRRKPGTSRHVTQRHEEDRVEILSGVFEGKTTGTPIGLLIRNVDAKSRDYSKIKDQFRPGHADYTYLQKYGIRDYRGGGRQSARETAVRVAAGAIAKKWLSEKHGIVIRGYMAQLGPVEIPFKSWDGVYDNPFFVSDPEYVARLEDFMDKLRKSGDSVGAKITTVASNVPVGWGEPVYDKLDADLAYNMMSINAVKGVEIGAGFTAVTQKGTQHSDEMTPEGFLGDLFRVVAAHVPPPPGVQSPLLWGSRSHLAKLFTDATAISHTVRQFNFRYRSAAHWVQVFRDFYGPVHKAFESLGASKQAALEADLLALLARSDRGGGAGLVVPAAYLETVVVR